MAGSKDMQLKNTDLLAAMQARAASNVQQRKLPDRPEEARTGPGQLAIFSGKLADALARAEAAEAEVERLKLGGESTELIHARAKLVEAEAALTAALENQPRHKANLDELHEVPGRRRKLTTEQYNELRDNLANNPLAHPVTVRARPEGGYEIISGNNRVAAYRDLKRHEIDITVLELTDDETDRTAFYSNLLAPTLTDYEKYLGFKARMTKTGYSQMQLAAEAGVKQPYISMLMTFDAMPAPAIDIIAQEPEKFGAKAIHSLAKLARRGNTEAVVEAIQKIASEGVGQGEAVRQASTRPQRAKRPEPMVIRQGKLTYCKALRTGTNSIRLDFAESINADEIFQAIAEFIRQKATSNQ